MRNRVQQVFRRAVAPVSILLLTGFGLLAQEPAPMAPPPSQMLAPNQLDSLVAPIALYPDPLLSQVLAAATYPLELTEAEQWLEHNPGMHGQELANAARQQNWDPSVQTLIAFPDVLGRLTSDIRWTTDLGNAFLAQQKDVMDAIQRMRASAMAEGKLQSNTQENVTTEMQGGQQAIDIQPANPNVVYVPYYNPEAIWGPPAWGYYPAWDFGIGFGWGPGIYLGGFFPGLSWGGGGWGCNWFGGFVFQRPFFFNHYGYWGFHGGAAWGRNTIWAHDGAHRLGVAYPNRGLATRYGGTFAGANRGFAGSRFQSSPYRPPQTNFGARTNGTTNGWSRFNGNATANNGYRPNGQNFGRGTSVPNTHSSAPSYNRSYAPSTHYSAPSYNRSYSAPSTHYSAPSYSAPRSFGGGGGGSFHSSGGGGGGFHGGGGGGSHGGHR